MKFRDEPRPRGGLLRCREFIMKDAYSFDADEEGAKKSYEQMRIAYTRIFDRLALRYRMVQADSGAIGGKTSAEFQVLVDSGEDAIVACDTCSYAANVEAATVMPTPPEREPEGAREKVHTPGHGTIDEVTKFLGVAPAKMLKSLLYAAGKDTVMVVVRGDHEVNPVLVARAVGVEEVFLATEGDVKKATGADVGFAGPLGFSGRMLIDRTAAGVKNGVTGANETDYHWKNVNLARDFTADVVDVRLATTGDTCPECGKGKLQSYKGIEGGHIFILGTRYTTEGAPGMNATYLDEQQHKKPLVMGCYGIGVSRLVATTVEQHNDENGIRWPLSIAPYQVHLVTLGKESVVAESPGREALRAELWARGVEVLWDDRDEAPRREVQGSQTSIGMPMRVTIGAKGLANGNVELKARTEPDPKKSELVPVAGAAERIAGWVKQGARGLRGAGAGPRLPAPAHPTPSPSPARGEERRTTPSCRDKRDLPTSARGISRSFSLLPATVRGEELLTVPGLEGEPSLEAARSRPLRERGARRREGDAGRAAVSPASALRRHDGQRRGAGDREGARGEGGGPRRPLALQLPRRRREPGNVRRGARRDPGRARRPPRPPRARASAGQDHRLRVFVRHVRRPPRRGPRRGSRRVHARRLRRSRFSTSSKRTARRSRGASRSSWGTTSEFCDVPGEAEKLASDLGARLTVFPGADALFSQIAEEAGGSGRACGGA